MIVAAFRRSASSALRFPRCILLINLHAYSTRQATRWRCSVALSGSVSSPLHTSIQQRILFRNSCSVPSPIQIAICSLLSAASQIQSAPYICSLHICSLLSLHLLSPCALCCCCPLVAQLLLVPLHAALLRVQALVLLLPLPQPVLSLAS